MHTVTQSAFQPALSLTSNINVLDLFEEGPLSHREVVSFLFLQVAQKFIPRAPT